MSMGRFIVFEGTEGVGKSTQIQLAQEWLATSHWFKTLSKNCPSLDSPILATREPGGTALGQELRQILLHSKEDIPAIAELFLYGADRHQHIETQIRPHLVAGGVVLCDRFTGSTVAYQGYGRGIDLHLIHQINDIATAGLQPDLTLWLDLPPAIGLERTRQRSSTGDRLENLDLAFHQRVYDGFRALANQSPEQVIPIDAQQNLGAIASDIQHHLNQKFHLWYGS
ncbi:dTMP kinase [Candidatus Synechococcus calcipolaris G9]|uniref:Thymidylate kinase n=1 Tax=Candidatus Synechococcus calcipolaris G9 TaxID=1497997 RepID=A0ABT6EZ63_9SYNE|nr:dTMP kinase [Candidatus Synechococcus calcipolaris]MDG2990785.1 dTMP kinase [Candidatus Synechococcus calcipolaris G9]